MNKPIPHSGLALLPFSFSKLKDYERCPMYAYHVHALKQRGPQSPQSARGDLIHQQAENYVKKQKVPGLPPSLLEYKAPLEQVVARGGASAELMWAVTATWKPTGWNATDAWGRGKIDLLAPEPELLRVVDYKTGKMYPETADQLRLYGVVAYALVPEAPLVRAEAWHLDLPAAKGLQTFDLRPSDAGPVRKDFEARVRKMARDTRLEPRPNQYCFNCHLSKKKGGPCPAA